MPTYEYKCSNCEAILELNHRVSDKPLKKCTKCNQDTLNRLISATSFTLKGGGWYSEGYATSGSSNNSCKTSKCPSSTSSTSSTSTQKNSSSCPASGCSSV